MPDQSRVEIRARTRVFDGFFKLDEFVVAHRQIDGTMSADQRRLVFERGDAAAVLLVDLDKQTVVLTRQFKLPTLVGRGRDDPTTSDGWVLEAIAGMIEPNETPSAAIIRETMEETGYEIFNPRLIAKFFSSPGGASERIFLFFATVHDADKKGRGGGVDDEDVKVEDLRLEELFDQLAMGSIDDPKLLIGGYWLKEHLRSLQDNGRLVSVLQPKQRPAAPASVAASQDLSLSTIRFAIKGRDDLIVGYKTGSIDEMSGVDIWVNSENTDMIMDRIIGKSISAKIRFLGANKDDQDNVVEDTIADALRDALGGRGAVRIGTVLKTEPGMLSKKGVRLILHVATVEARPGFGFRTELSLLKDCVDKVLTRVDAENYRLWRQIVRFIFRSRRLTSVLLPLFGTGDGGYSVEQMANALISSATKYLQMNQATTLREVYFIAYSTRHRNACEVAFEQLCAEGALTRSES